MSKKKRSFSELFHEWDEDRIDLTQELTRAGHSSSERPQRREWTPQHIRSIEEREVRYFRRLYPALAVILTLVIVGTLMLAVTSLPRFGSADNPGVNEVMERYVESGMEETGAVNIVAGIILDYRAFDTLGESFVLFTAVSAVLILMLVPANEPAPVDDDSIFNLQNDVVLRFSVRIIAPVVIIFGIYVILGGHLGPGGGFSGGAIMGAGLMLFSMSYGAERVSRLMSMRVFRTITLIALSFYACSKCYSFFTGANHLESFISTGVPGRIISAGLILPLNMAVGMVVACTMYGFYSVFKRGRI